MNELNQFCILASSQKGLALTALIQQVLNSKKIYNFGELLSIPSVQGMISPVITENDYLLTCFLLIVALATQSEYVKSFATLELLAYGTYSDYMVNSSRYLELTREQENKLRLLSIVSLASASHELHYSVLKGSNRILRPTHPLAHSINQLAYLLTEQLYVTKLRELEDIIIECIYSGLISGKIDHRGNVLRVSECIRRDVPTTELDNIINILKAWKNKMNSFEKTLKLSSETIQKSRRRQKSEEEEAQKVAEKTKNSLQQQASGGARVL